jgi:hypothetical protein
MRCCSAYDVELIAGDRWGFQAIYTGAVVNTMPKIHLRKCYNLNGTLGTLLLATSWNRASVTTYLGYKASARYSSSVDFSRTRIPRSSVPRIVGATVTTQLNAAHPSLAHIFHILGCSRFKLVLGFGEHRIGSYKEGTCLDKKDTEQHHLNIISINLLYYFNQAST